MPWLFNHARNAGIRLATRQKPVPHAVQRFHTHTNGYGFLWGGVCVLFFLAFVFGNTPEAQERMRARDAIDLCWKEQQRKSLDPGAQRFIAGACEKMESDFTERYGQRP